VKVSLVRAGGIAGLTTTTAVDSKAISPDQARELHDHVEKSGVFDLPEHTPPRDHPDSMHYALTVEDGDRVRTVSMPEDALSEPVNDLIAFMDSVPGREESVG
jgi:hypothetical protein